MKQIFNWTAGAFFRSVGRFIFFVLIGGLFAFLIAKSGLKIPDFLNPLYIVNASVLDDWTSSQSRYRYDDHGTNTYSSWETTPHTWEPTLPVNKIQWRVKYSQGLSYENTYIIKFAYRPIPQAVSPSRIQVYADTGTVEYEEITCGQWAYNGDGFNVVQCTFTPKNNISASTWLIIEVNLTQGYLTSLRTYMNQFEERTGTNAVITQQTEKINETITNLEETIQQNNEELINVITENNQVCESFIIDKSTNGVINGYLSTDCKGLSSSSGSSHLSGFYSLSSSSTLEGLRTDGYYCFYDDSKTAIGSRTRSSISSITIPENAKYVRFQTSNNANPFFKLYSCMSNAESTNGKIEELNDTLTDTDTDEDSNSIYNQMHDFNLSIEGPLTSILNIPIQLLDDLLVDYNSTDSHSDLCFTLKGVESCIPSGDILWKRTTTGVHDNRYYWFGTPDFVSFRSFFELVVGGYLTYLLLKKLVDSIEKGLDPTINEVKIMNL